MNISVGSDHAGFELKNDLLVYLLEKGYNPTDMGPDSADSVDYPDYAHRVADSVQAGIVWVNAWLVRDLRTPFGGVKASGVGREGGWEALRFFTEAKNIFIKY
jgi:aminomuconate-semialdehyde/2-hydroxymuconate-6-semialdehyde dehydrogenase